MRGNTKAKESCSASLRRTPRKAHKPNEFGKLVLIQEAENQIVTRYQVCEQRAADSTLLGGCLEQHVKQFGRAPERVAADPGFFSAANESKAGEMGVNRVSIPSHDTKSPTQTAQKQRWFKELQKWRTGCEGRISSQTPPWAMAVALQRTGRHPALGRTRGDRRQRHIISARTAEQTRPREVPS